MNWLTKALQILAVLLLVLASIGATMAPFNLVAAGLALWFFAALVASWPAASP